MIHPLSPTAVLPALGSLQSYNAARLGEALRVLREVYFPKDYGPTSSTSAVPVLKQSLSDAVPAPRPKRVARLAHHDGVPDSGYASAEEDDSEDEDYTENEVERATDLADSESEALDILRLDDLERNYAIKWLTGLVKRGDDWTSFADCSSEEESERTTVLENASRLLARFAGDDEPEEAVTRTFRFPFRPDADSEAHNDSPITIEMNDAPFDGSDHTAVGLQSWGSAIVLAKRLCANPERYLRTSRGASATHTHRLRILELGAGTGMLSIAVAKVLGRLQCEASIVATDYHPSVLSNLTHNVHVNLPTSHSISATVNVNVTVYVEALDWSAPPKLRDTELYDVVLAADVVYDPKHAAWIRDCVTRTMRKEGVFWLIMPLRAVGRHEGLGRTVVEAFPEVGVGIGVGVGEGEGEGEGAGVGVGMGVREDHDGESKLMVVHREEVGKVDGVGRADEGGYTLFEIRWM